MPDEVRPLNNANSLLFVRGERAMQDKKIDLLKHPNINLTNDGGHEPYITASSEKQVIESAMVRADTVNMKF